MSSLVSGVCVCVHLSVSRLKEGCLFFHDAISDLHSHTHSGVLDQGTAFALNIVVHGNSEDVISNNNKKYSACEMQIWMGDEHEVLRFHHNVIR